MKIPRINKFGFLGYKFTHKSKLLPKSMFNYYEKTYYPKEERTFLEKIPYNIQKFINKLFPNYLVETSTQHRARTYWGTSEFEIYIAFLDAVERNKIEGVKISKEEIKKIRSLPSWDERITSLRKLYDEGRLGKPLE